MSRKPRSSTVIFGGTDRSAIVHAFVSSPLHGHSILSMREGRVLEILSILSYSFNFVSFSGWLKKRENI